MAHTIRSADSSRLPSERTFGFTFSVIFVVVGLYGVYASWNSTTSALLAFTGACVLLVAIMAPRLLAPFNKAWFHLGELLGRVVSPVVLGILFFALVTPVSIVTRLFGRDELRLKPRSESSYWVVRESPTISPDSFKQQF